MSCASGLARRVVTTSPPARDAGRGCGAARRSPGRPESRAGLRGGAPPRRRRGGGAPPRRHPPAQATRLTRPPGPWWRLGGVAAVVDVEDGAVDEAGLVAGQVADRGG